MTKYACMSCGVQYKASNTPPSHCIICQYDDKYSAPETGQAWVKLAQHRNKYNVTWQELEDGLSKISMDTDMGIGQHAHFLQTTNGNYLWDAIPLINDQLIEDINAKGGLKAIAISHPDFYSNIADWATEFNVPVYIHHNDREWFQDDDDNILFWHGDTLRLEDDLTLINCGGHFKGSSVMHWQQGAQGKGSVLAGDTIAPNSNKTAIFRHSYTRDIMLKPDQVKHIGKLMEHYKFDKLYGAFKFNILSNAHNIVQQSVKQDLESR